MSKMTILEPNEESIQGKFERIRIEFEPEEIADTNSKNQLLKTTLRNVDLLLLRAQKCKDTDKMKDLVLSAREQIKKVGEFYKQSPIQKF